MWPNHRCAAQFRGIASVETDDTAITMALHDQMKNEADDEPTAEELTMIVSTEFYCTQQAEKNQHRYC